MPSNKIDPRVIRTKHLLVEAFLNVSQEKEMTQITMKNIIDRATGTVVLTDSNHL